MRRGMIVILGLAGMGCFEPTEPRIWERPEPETLSEVDDTETIATDSMSETTNPATESTESGSDGTDSATLATDSGTPATASETGTGSLPADTGTGADTGSAPCPGVCVTPAGCHAIHGAPWLQYACDNPSHICCGNGTTDTGTGVDTGVDTGTGSTTVDTGTGSATSDTETGSDEGGIMPGCDGRCYIEVCPEGWETSTPNPLMCVDGRVCCHQSDPVETVTNTVDTDSATEVGYCEETCMWECVGPYQRVPGVCTETFECCYLDPETPPCPTDNPKYTCEYRGTCEKLGGYSEDTNYVCIDPRNKACCRKWY